MVTSLISTLLVAWVALMVRYPARPAGAGAPAHPPEGYPFGDPESPTRAERSARVLQGVGSPD